MPEKVRGTFFDKIIQIENDSDIILGPVRHTFFQNFLIGRTSGRFCPFRLSVVPAEFLTLFLHVVDDPVCKRNWIHIYDHDGA